MVEADLAIYLESQGIGVQGTTLFYGIIPPDPDAVTCIYVTGGKMNEPDLGTGNTRLEYPSVQIVTRGVRDDYDTPRNKATDVVTAMTKIINQNLNGTRYLAALARHTPMFFRRDENFRCYFTTNFDVTKVY